MIGGGYVGLVSGACFAEFGSEVTVVETNAARLAALRVGQMPIFEPGLAELVTGNVKAGRLSFTTDLAEGIGLGLMAEFDAVYDEADGDHDLEFLHSAVLGFDLTERLGLFAEYIGIASPAPYQAYLSGGLTLSLGEDLMLDCGAKAGLNENSDDFGAFAGFTKRF